MNRRQRQTACQACGCGPTIDPRKFKRNQREGQIFWSGDEPTLLGLHEDGRDPGLVECVEQFSLGRCPVMRIAATACH